METRPTRDIPGAFGAAAFAAVGLYAVVASFRMTMLGAIFPRTVGGILLGLALVQLVVSLRPRIRRPQPLQEGAQGDASPDEAAEAASLGRRVVLVAVMLAWAFLFPVVGFLVTSLAAAPILLAAAQFGPVRPAVLVLRLALLALVIGTFYWVMLRVLHIPMPRAWLF